MQISEFEQHIGITFTRKELLEQAFIHRSFINENPRSGLRHNERLEFLGDAVLELVVTSFLYKTYDNHSEGDLTSYRAALVNAVTLGDVAHSLSFNDMMKLSKGEARDVTRARMSILADAYEAFVGAVYLDQGYDVAQDFITRTLLVRTEELIKKGLHRDAKSLVQERSQDIYGVTPTYKVVAEEGPDHDKHFRVAIYFGDNQIAEGEGKSKQEAETSAAKEALVVKKWVNA